MAEQGFKRKLAAILSADVVGYSAMMRDDEDATIRTLTSYRFVISNLIEKFRGHVMDTTGDNLLAEFSSVVDAVNCAVEIQRELAEQNAELPQNRRMAFRIGVNLGDVVEEEGRIYGDGVNIAARLEGLAEAGCICISGSVFDSVESRLGLEYEFLGEQEVKNIDKPVRAYRVLSFPGAAAHRVVKAKEAIGRRWRNFAVAAGVVFIVVAAIAGWQYSTRQPEDVETASLDNMAFPLPEQPSIAVLPFVNMSGDPELEYIGDGISENIITSLSKVAEIFIISRQSTFSYKGKPVKVKQVAEEMGVRYVLEGSFQKSDDRLRVNAQLIDALTGYHLWAENYDRDMQDLFEIMDAITKEIVVALQVKLTHGEQARLYAKSTDNLEAWGYFNKALTLVYHLNKEDNARGRKLVEQAVKLDPDFAPAWMVMASTYSIEALNGWGASRAESHRRAIECGRKLVAIDATSAMAHMMLGRIHKWEGRIEESIIEGEKSILLEPGNSEFHIFLAQTMARAGKPQEAVTLSQKAMRLNPFYPPLYLVLLAQWIHWTGDYEEALATYDLLADRDKEGELPPLYSHLGLTAAYLELGRVDEAREHFEAVRRISPDFSFIGWAQSRLGYKGKDLERLQALVGPLEKKTQSVAMKKLRFVHTGTPGFSLKYPGSSKKVPKDSDDEVLSMKCPTCSFYASVADIPEGSTLADVGPNIYAPGLSSSGSNIKVLSNNSFTLKDGTHAYKTTIKWLWRGNTALTTQLVSAFKDGKWVYVSTHTWQDSEEAYWIVESLRFD